MSHVMQYKILAALFATSLLGACAGMPDKQSASTEPSLNVDVAREIKRPEPPKQVMTVQVLYEILLAEIAMQRGDEQLAARAYLDLMQQTQDYRIAERAAQIALNARLTDEALLAAE